MDNNIPAPRYNMDLQGYEAEAIELWREGVDLVNKGKFGLAEERFNRRKR